MRVRGTTAAKRPLSKLIAGSTGEMGTTSAPLLMLLTLLPVAATAQPIGDAEADAGVTFAETVAHLGGLPALAGAVVVLALAYLALVGWLLPRGRRLHQFDAPRRQIKSARKRE